MKGRLHYRELPALQSRRLKDKRPESGCPAKQPQRAADEIRKKAQAFCVAHSAARACDVLRCHV